jgi:PAS domain-containing protein
MSPHGGRLWVWEFAPRVHYPSLMRPLSAGLSHDIRPLLNVKVETSRGCCARTLSGPMLMLPQLYINAPAVRPGTLGGYALAFVSVGVATLLRLAVDPYIVGVPFVTFWPAVITTALISGIGAGLFCIMLSAAAAIFFVIEPHLSFYIGTQADLNDLLVFLVLACFSVIIITQLHDAIEREQAERALRESKERLQFALDTAQVGWCCPAYRFSHLG